MLFDFEPLGRREVVGRFDGGTISSDGGGILLREVEGKTGIMRQFAACFEDHRDPELIEFTVEQLLAQRVYGLALGYEDLADHDDLRRDPLLATLVGKADPTGHDRPRQRDRGIPLAGKSTLDRLELTPAGADADSRYKKIVMHTDQIDAYFVDVFVQAHATPPKQMVIDIDTTFAPLHGHQLGRFFHGYYDCYCYLPLYVFCGEHLLAAKLRPADIDGAAGALTVVRRIVAQIRRHWPQVELVLRGDSGFCREPIMRACESDGVHYLFGMAKNKRLCKIIGAALQQAKTQYEATGQPARIFQEFDYATRKSWSRQRRVVAKAEHLEKGSNPRFVVTSLPAERFDAQTLYEREYCARGEMENRIKEQQLYLFADRVSPATMRANQLRLYAAGAAYVLMHALRRLALQDTPLEKAQAPTIRQKLLKIGTRVRVTTRRVWLSWSQAYPYQALWQRIVARLRALAAWKPPPTVAARVDTRRVLPMRC
jgi:hypothetical protein